MKTRRRSSTGQFIKENEGNNERNGFNNILEEIGSALNSVFIVLSWIFTLIKLLPWIFVLWIINQYFDLKNRLLEVFLDVIVKSICKCKAEAGTVIENGTRKKEI